MRRIGIEEPTAIRPEMLYRLKRRDRTQRDGLVGAQSGVRHDIGGKCLRLALLNHHQRQHKRYRQQHAGREPDKSVHGPPSTRTFFSERKLAALRQLALRFAKGDRLGKS